MDVLDRTIHPEHGHNKPETNETAIGRSAVRNAADSYSFETCGDFTAAPTGQELSGGKRKRGGDAWFAAAAAVVVLLAGTGYDKDQNVEQELPPVETTLFELTPTEYEALRKQAGLEKTRENEALTKNNASADELGETKSELNDLSEQLELEKKRTDRVLAKYNAAAIELNETKAKLNEIETELNALRKQAELEKTRADEAMKKCNEAEKNLEETKHELERQSELLRHNNINTAEALAKSLAAEKELVEVRSELSSTQAQLNGMVRVLTDVNNELVKAKNESNQYRQSLAATQKKLVASQEKVDQLERLIEEKDRQIAKKQQAMTESRREADELKRPSANNLLNSYNASTLELSFHLVNDRLFNNISIDKSFFLPALRIGGRDWIVSAFRDTTGLNICSGYTRVTELQYKVRRPQAMDSWAGIAGPALCLAEDPRVCMFPVPGNDAVPMEILTYEKLRERGLDDLTLFKSETFSKASADIADRCSLSLDSGDNHLYIRNPNRSSAELKAEVGDFVISKEGAFVGVVVKVDSTLLGQTSTAICYVFQGEPDLSKALPLDLSTSSPQGYSEFVNTHEILRKIAERLDQKK